jgi:hypothetical protein
MTKYPVIVLYSIVISGTLLLSGCQQKPEVSFDYSAWQEDKNGCELKRYDIYPDVIKEKEKLLELNSRNLIKILGSPERNELYRRNQKFFIYYITPSEICETGIFKEDPLYLIIRFNALGLSSEIYLSAKKSPTME